MLFSEFKNPKVLLDIQRTLNEEVHVDNYYNFIGNKSKIIGKSIGNGLFSHDDGTYSFNNGTKSINFKSLDAATEYSEAKRNQFKKSLIAAHNVMTANTKLSDNDVRAMSQYTNHLGVLNHKLLHGYELNERESELKDALDHSLSTNKTYDDLVVYSGTNKLHSKALRQGGVVDHPSYISTSLSANSARAFAAQKGGDVVKIHVPKGHPGIYVSHISDYDGEREVVLPRGLKLKIHKDKEQTLIHDSGEYVVHHATIEDANQ